VSLKKAEVLEHMGCRGGTDVGYFNPVFFGEETGVPSDPALFDQPCRLLQVFPGQ